MNTHKLKRASGRAIKLSSIAIAVSFAFIYLSFCLFLYARQRQLIFRPSEKINTLPSAPEFKLLYEDVWISLAPKQRLHGWWISAPSPQEKFAPIPNEPTKILKSSKVILYFAGAGGNISYYNYIAKIQGLRQLGYSVLMVDYRGFGLSRGYYPSEAQLYADSQAIWRYLTKTRKVVPEQIIIYGESLGGAIAIDLALKQPRASGLIVQGSFTSMAATVKQMDWLWLFPIDWLLTQDFNSLSKVKSLQVPVLFIHGTNDTVIPAYMSQQLYKAAPQPKQLLLVPKVGHYRIYQPGKFSYLQKIAAWQLEIDSESMK
jgi:uncharacterized protein